jgi:hypothetical protein
MSFWPPRWSPTSPSHATEAEKKLLSRLGPLAGILRPFQVQLDEQRSMNTIVIDQNPEKKDKPVLVMAHGYGAGLGFFYRTFLGIFENTQ